MAWGVSSTPGSVAQTTTTTSSWDFGGTLGALVGDVFIIVIATDNRTTTNGNTNDHTSMTTTSGETATKLYEYTNGQGSAAAGACVSAWRLSPALSTSLTNPTINLSGTVGKLAAIWQAFTASANPTFTNVGTPQVLENDAADPGSMTLGSLTSREHLWIRGIAAETNTDTSLTSTGSGWVAMASGGGANASTTGGGSTNNIAAGGEYLIATNTTATSNPTWVSADCASVLVAIDEDPGSTAPFPRRMPLTQRQLWGA